jgi:molybdopterin/thiamine biosynthesis adenylyltransferase
VDLVLGCVDNFEARMAINQVRATRPHSAIRARPARLQH